MRTRLPVSGLFIRQLIPFRSTRLDRIQRIAWESGKQLPPHIQEKMSAGEQKYFRDYVKLIDEYSKNVGLKMNGKLSGFDLSVD
jgi:hypothetical protein